MAISECRIRRQVQFYEVDSAGIVHFSWFYRYMEEAEHALWRSAGLSMAPTPERAYPRVAAAFDFRRPLRLEDQADVLIRVVAMGRSSIGYRCVISVNGDVAAVGTMTVVCVTGAPAQPRAIEMPAFIRDRLEISTDVPD
jgi:YbgC/YbaW family acyl-CoA thioester hydrolase